MATVKFNLDTDKDLTDEEKEMIRNAAEIPYVPDDDSPELPEEQIVEFKRIIQERNQQRQKKTVSLRLSNSTLSTAKSLGKSYTTILSTVLENVFKDVEALKKYL